MHMHEAPLLSRKYTLKDARRPVDACVRAFLYLPQWDMKALTRNECFCLGGRASHFGTSLVPHAPCRPTERSAMGLESTEWKRF